MGVTLGVSDPAVLIPVGSEPGGVLVQAPMIGSVQAKADTPSILEVPPIGGNVFGQEKPQQQVTSAGFRGPQGLVGEQGEQGPTGPQGEQGIPGPPLKILGELPNETMLPITAGPGESYLILGHLWSWSGTAWIDCGVIQGPEGPQGIPGSQGLEGPQGIQGIQGPEGPQGPQGIDGPQGPQGPEGPQGIEGLPGAEGAQGPQGLPGDTGPMGPEGPQGSIGPQGPKGDTGAAGTTTQYQATAASAITAGDFVHVYHDGSSLKATQAYAGASSPKRTHGSALNTAGIGDPVNVLSLGGINSGVTSLTPGLVYFLSTTTPGKVQAVAPGLSGEIWQELGMAISPTELATFNGLVVELD